MKTCKNCGGPLDDKGKCIVCGTVTHMTLSNDDGVIIHKSYKELYEELELIYSINDRGDTNNERYSRS